MKMLLVILYVSIAITDVTNIIALVSKFRNCNIHAEFYPDPVKLNKQLKYANANGVPFVLFNGKENDGNYELKDMKSGVQQLFKFDEIITHLKK